MSPSVAVAEIPVETMYRICYVGRRDLIALRVSRGNLITNLIVREGDVAINLLPLFSAPLPIF